MNKMIILIYSRLNKTMNIVNKLTSRFDFASSLRVSRRRAKQSLFPSERLLRRRFAPPRNDAIWTAMILIPFLLFAFTGTQANAGEAVEVWAVGDCHKINPVTGQDYNPFVSKDISERNYIWDSNSDTVTLFGAKNEYTAFQIIIEAKNRDIENVNVTFTDFSGQEVISKENIELFKEFYTHVWKKSDWPLPSTGIGEYPDALIPFSVPEHGAPFSINKGRNQAVWVDIYIPKGTSAGNYTGTFTVFSNKKGLKKVTVDLTVWDFTLPDENHLICWSNYYAIRYAYGLSRDDNRYIDIEQSIWKISHKHRLNALLRHANVRPRSGYTAQGRLIIDFQAYVERVKGYLDGTIFADKMPPDIFLLPLSGGTEPRWPRRPQKSWGIDADEAFLKACREVATYYREMGWDLDKCYIYLSDEPEKDKIDRIINDANIIRNADKGLQTMVALFRVFNADTVEKLSGSVDMWLVDASYYDSKLLLPRKKLGERIGFYQQGEPWCGNENMDSDGLSFVTWPWIAWKYNVDCIYLYSMTEWGGLEKGHSVWQYVRNKSWSNSQGILIYPGNFIGINEVVESIRLKQIRRGMQDYEYMYLARQKGADPDKIVNTIIRKALDETDRPGGTYGEWAHNPEDWFLARKNLASLVLGHPAIPMENVTIPEVKEKPHASVKTKKTTLTERLKWLRSFFLKKGWGNKSSVNKEDISKTSQKLPQGPISVKIYPSKEKRSISKLIYGTNLSQKMESDRYIWDFVKNRGITCFRYPGGGSPGWRWKQGYSDFNPKSKDMPLAKVDYLIEFCKRANAELIMQVNVESGTPEEAAELVDYLNKKGNFRVEYWELGNEVYGDWDKGYMTPENYAKLIKEYSTAMKSIDPTIKIGANWGERFYDTVGWDETIIKEAADHIDFVSYHWYPNHINKRHVFDKRTHPTSEEVMGNSMEIPNIVTRVNRIIEQYAPHRKGKIEITFLEWDGAWDAPSSDPIPPYAQGIAQWSLANATFYADCLGQFAENGITISAHYNLQECMFGLIRGWDRSEGWGGKKWDTETIRPKAFALELFSKHFGDITIENEIKNSPYYNKAEDYWPSSYTGNVPYISCYTSKFSNSNKLGIILVNKHPKEDFDIELSVDKSSKVASIANVWILKGPDIMAQNDGRPGTVRIEKSITENLKNEFTYTLPAHSVVAMEIELI